MGKKAENDEMQAVETQKTETEALPSEVADKNDTVGHELETMAVLADRYRVPSWQLAALLRYMGWTDDKLVADIDFAEALESLKNRRIGGGRR